MISDNTVVLGEASESDSEEISLGGDENILNEPGDPSRERTSSIDKNRVESSAATQQAENYNNGNKNSNTKSGFGSSLLASIGPSSALAKLVSSYNLLASNLTPTTMTRSSTMMTVESQTNDFQMSPLHKTLYMKNQQLYASINHLFKHPYEKSCSDLHTISQRLVGVQRIIQEVNSDVLKMKRELKNLDVKLRMIF